MKKLASLQDILPTVLQKRHLTHESNASYVIEKTKHILEEFFEESIAAKITPQKFSPHGVLSLSTRSSGALHLFKLQQTNVIKALQASLPEIKKVQISITS